MQRVFHWPRRVQPGPSGLIAGWISSLETHYPVVTGAAGFDNAQVDAAFFAGTRWRSNFLVNLGHGDPAKLFPRSPRLSFDEAARIV